ncbi:MAG: cupredoxin domain-containing protein [Sporichthyaceae bacterium]
MNRKLAAAGISVAMAAGLAALGSGTANAADPPCTDPAPGVCDKADPNDPFSNPAARCPKGGEPARTITASGNTFCGKTYAGKTGETWTFNNPDIAIHNVASDDFEKNPAKFKSADVEMGKTGTFTMPKKKGKYTIICTYHPGSMTAKLTLK